MAEVSARNAADAAPPIAASGTFQLGDRTIHRLGYGAMRITGPGIWGPPADEGEAVRVLRRVIELGVDFIDTADSYGPYVSEDLIRDALHPYPAGLVIATKAGLVRTGPGEWAPVGRPEYLRQECEMSLRRLGVEVSICSSCTASIPRCRPMSSMGSWPTSATRARSATWGSRRSRWTRWRRPVG